MADDANPSCHRVGVFELVALLDAVGAFPLPVEQAFTGAVPDDWDAARRLDPPAIGEDGSWRLAFRSFAVRRPDDGVTLVDLGVGGDDGPAASWAPTPGNLPVSMQQASIDPADVDTVVFTHLHSDHVGWVLDPLGYVHFPLARHMVQRREVEELRHSLDQSAWQRTIQPLLDHHLLDAIDGPAVLTAAAKGEDRIEVVPTPGHTAGHPVSGNHVAWTAGSRNR